jgi:hypothetical protein
MQLGIDYRTGPDYSRIGDSQYHNGGGAYDDAAME